MDSEQNPPTAPVMDVTAPPPKNIPEQGEVATAPPYEASEYVETEIPEEQNSDNSKADKNEKKEPIAEAITDDKKQAKDKKNAVTQAKTNSPSSSVGLAIIATVVIVFGLAAIATYAFMNQNS